MFVAYHPPGPAVAVRGPPLVPPPRGRRVGLVGKTTEVVLETTLLTVSVHRNRDLDYAMLLSWLTLYHCETKKTDEMPFMQSTRREDGRVGV